MGAMSWMRDHPAGTTFLMFLLVIIVIIVVVVVTAHHSTTDPSTSGGGGSGGTSTPGGTTGGQTGGGGSTSQPGGTTGGQPSGGGGGSGQTNGPSGGSSTTVPASAFTTTAPSACQGLTLPSGIKYLADQSVSGNCVVGGWEPSGAPKGQKSNVSLSECASFCASTDGCQAALAIMDTGSSTQVSTCLPNYSMSGGSVFPGNLSSPYYFGIIPSK